MKAVVFVAFACASLAACTEPTIDAGGDPEAGSIYDDPLGIDDQVQKGSFDDLYRRVIVTSCSGQQGLCHNGQFEPNLSTPALAWVNLVERPSLEKADRHRVSPGDPDKSLLIDKLRGRDVISRMPLGAEPLSEDDIEAFEGWISGGALRAPDAEPVGVIDNPPEEPSLGIFDTSGERLDALGAAVAKPGSEVVLRMTTHDFETPDAAIPYAFFLLETAYGDVVVLDDEAPAGQDYVGYATLDPTGPEIGAETFDWAYHYVVPDTVTLYKVDGTVDRVPSSGLSLLLVGGYADGSEEQAMALSFTVDALRIEP